MVDAVSFRERNPNYFFPQVDERSSLDDLFSEDDSKNDREVTKQRASYTPEDLLLCSATVYGFCFQPNGSFRENGSRNWRLLMSL
jgi:hypothetical protein